MARARRRTEAQLRRLRASATRAELERLRVEPTVVNDAEPPSGSEVEGVCTTTWRSLRDCVARQYRRVFVEEWWDLVTKKTSRRCGLCCPDIEAAREERDRAGVRGFVRIVHVRRYRLVRG